MVQARTTDEVIRVGAKSAGSKALVTSSNNQAEYWSGKAKEYSDSSKGYYELSKDWAIKTNDKVDGAEYSSKYYALKAKTEHESALADLTQAEQSAITTINTYKSNAINAVNEVQTTAEESIEALETASLSQLGSKTSEGVQTLNTATTAHVSELNTKTSQGISSINKTVSTAQSVISADVVSARNSAELARESAAKSIGWNINYVDEDCLMFTDKTPQEIEDNINYIEETADVIIADMTTIRNTTEGYKNDASTYKGQAETAKNDAVTAKDQAQQYATNASGYATSASQSATSANASKERCEAIEANIQTEISGKQDKLTAGDNITIASQGGGDLTISAYAPTKTSDLTNDSGYITSSYHDSTKQDTINDLATIRSCSWNIQFNNGTLIFNSLGA